MPIANYGVLIGTYADFKRDSRDDFGKYYHGHIFVRVPNPSGGGTLLYDCAVDVNKPDGNIAYFHPVILDPEKFTKISSKVNGFHALASNLPDGPTSGALDYLRNPFISLPLGCLGLVLALLNIIDRGNRHVWEENVGTSALDTLEAMCKSGDIARVYVFGARYYNARQNPPQGMHDVHYNQGDPPGDHYASNGIWQDGGVVVQHSDGRLEGFFVKFDEQSLKTNDYGQPI